ncbi:recombinase family protein [Streptomyces yunnanensis]|uniref:Recombinase family protein n=1 Tax=Streptomyces yunnanensis TaxID=156453 RepID=A0ABY8AJ28_9ACTN|nr:recombinase family protein [Streptomyces yunnanensis]WEB43631.1 recombinase family protein [Streptomyces yunnanensis]
MVDVRDKPRRKGRGYIRVSKKRRDMISPEIQQDEIDLLAERENIEQVAEPLQDLGLSGREFEERQINKLVEDVEARLIDVVLLWKWSRFGRNTLQSLLNIQRIYDAGGDVRAATEDFDGRTSVGRLQITQMLGWAQFQSDQIGENWQSAHKYRRKKGLPHSGFKTFGYKICFTCPPNEPGERRNKCNECREGIQKLDPATKDVLAEVWRRFTFQNEPMKRICDDLWERGYRTESGERITPTQMYKWLDSGFSLGWVRWRSKEKILQDKKVVREGRKNYYRSSRPEYFDVWVTGAHEPVIKDPNEREILWLTYLSKRFGSPQLPKSHHDPKYSISGLARCTGLRLFEITRERGKWKHAVCGRNEGAFSRGKERIEQYPPLPNGDRNPHTVYFRCTHGALYKDCTGSGSIGVARAERELLDWLTQQAKGAASVDEKMATARDQFALKGSADEQEEVAKQLKELDEESSRLVRGYTKGIIDEDKYVEEKQRIESEISEARERLERSSGKVVTLRPAQARFLGLIEEWEHMTYSRKRQALSTVISHFWVYRDRRRSKPRIRVVPLWAEEHDRLAPPSPVHPSDEAD